MEQSSLFITVFVVWCLLVVMLSTGIIVTTVLIRRDASKQLKEDETLRPGVRQDVGVVSHFDKPWAEPQRKEEFAPVFSKSDIEVSTLTRPVKRTKPVDSKAVELQFGLPEKSVLSGRATAKGEVFQLPNGHEVIFLREPSGRSVSTDASLLALIEHGNQVKTSIGPENGIHLRWPEQELGDKSGPILGYESSGLPPNFLTGKSASAARVLSYASKDKSLDTRSRLEILRLVAVIIETLHLNSVIHGKVELEAFAYSTGPVEVAVIDYVDARLLGRSSWSGRTARSSRYETLNVSDTSFDDDRHRFAQLAWQILASDSSLPSVIEVPTALKAAVGDNVSRGFRFLWERSLGAPGTMPTMREWLGVLELARK